MDRPKVARRIIPSRKSRAKNFRKKYKATNPPKIDNEGKKADFQKKD